MRFTDFLKRYLTPVLIISLLAVLVLSTSGCEDFGLVPTQTPDSEEQTEEPAPPPTTVGTEDRAILAVHAHLLGQAESYQAKDYLADFYTAVNQWWANSERFKDGSSIWVVVVEATDAKIPSGKTYWQQASWFILQDGTVMPSNRLPANALRIEADLQELSRQPDVIQGESTNGGE